MEATLTSPASIQDLAAQVPSDAPALKDLMEDGVYVLFLLRSGTTPHSALEFNRRVDAFLDQFERHATNFGKPMSAIRDCKYAFCALLDEIILNSEFGIREEWERNPLQLRLFGEHLAGEGFFDRLENLRLEPQKHIETLEVFYTCLILGFQGKYLLESEDKLGYLTARIGQEITSIRGASPSSLPTGNRPSGSRNSSAMNCPCGSSMPSWPWSPSSSSWPSRSCSALAPASCAACRVSPSSPPWPERCIRSTIRPWSRPPFSTGSWTITPGPPPSPPRRSCTTSRATNKRWQGTWRRSSTRAAPTSTTTCWKTSP